MIKHIRSDSANGPLRQPTTPGERGHAEKEIQLLDYLDGRLSPTEVRQVEAHLNACAACAELRENWRALDVELIRAEPPRLSPDFERGLWLRIAAQSRQGLKTYTPQSLEAELGQHWNRIRKSFLRSQVQSLLDYVGVTAAVAVGCYFVYGGPLQGLAHALGWIGNTQQLMLAAGGLASLVILLGSLALATRKGISRWLNWL